MNQARWIPMLLILSWMLAGGGCGGGGGGSPGPAPDLSGWWFEEWYIQGGEERFVPSQVVELIDDGSTVVYGNHLLHKNGWSLSLDEPNATDPDRQVWRYAIRSADRIEGTLETYRDDALDSTYVRRLTPTTPPSGTLVINGTIEGGAVSVDVTRAYALEQGATGTSTAIWIVDPDTGPKSSLALWLDTPGHLPVGTHDVGGASDEMYVEARADSLLGTGADGNVELTHSTADRIAGWYIVTLDDGSSITGSFDVDIWSSSP